MRVDLELRAAAMDLPLSSEKAVPSCELCFRLLHKTLPAPGWQIHKHLFRSKISLLLEFDATLVQYSREALSHRLPITEHHTSST